MKIALVYAFQDSDWFSCTVILKNLIETYEKRFGAENILHINHSSARFTRGKDYNKIINDKVEKIIFLSHKPTPLKFLTTLSNLDGSELAPNRDYIFHIYGDFPLYLQEWRAVFKLLTEKKVKLICASTAQKKMIEKFFIQTNIVYECPFPVNNKQFYYDESLRKSTREHFNISDSAKVFLYTGRLSYQKKITDLVEKFCIALAEKIIPHDSKLMLVGSFDNLGVLYLGTSRILGEYFREVERVICRYEKFRGNIHFIPNVAHSELNAIYNCADVFFSLGTYHDEDFGMSVAEGICCGLSAVLTKWAGYRSFQLSDHPECCELIPVQLDLREPKIDDNQVLPAMKRVLEVSHGRADQAKWAQDKFSIEACMDILGNILNSQVETFQGRSSLHKRLANENAISSTKMFKQEKDNIFNDMYFEVYDVYTR